MSIIVFSTEGCLTVQEDEFMCKNEVVDEKDIDPMVYWLKTPGTKARERYQKEHISSLKVENLFDDGNVVAFFNPTYLQILRVISYDLALQLQHYLINYSQNDSFEINWNRLIYVLIY